MSKKTKIISIIIAGFAIVGLVITLLCLNHNDEIEGFRKLKSIDDFNEIFDDYSYGNNKGLRLFTLPWSIIADNNYGYRYVKNAIDYDVYEEEAMVDIAYDVKSINSSAMATKEMVTSGTGTIDDSYSKTNIQVENVDEADRVKTNGDYIFNINNEKVYIINAKDNDNLKETAEVVMLDDAIPEDIMLGNNKLVVIGRTSDTKYVEPSTRIEVYDLSDMNDIKLVKSYTLDKAYQTSRLVDNRLVVITNGYYYNRNDDFKPVYKVNDDIFDVEAKNIFVNKKYFENGISNIASIDLNDLDNINVYMATINSNVCYVSEDNIYIMKEFWSYDYDNDINIGCIFGLKGIFGCKEAFGDYNASYGSRTKILKLSMEKNNTIDVKCVKTIKGNVINQFSFDEKDGNLRIAVDNIGKNNNESGVVILDKNLNQIGFLDGIAPGERIYAARFMGNRLYLVTYKNMDPLFVIDLTNNNPKVLGELKIPGYSQYLHPYDDNHIIGIGVDTKTKVYYDAFGRVVSETSETLGLKMALFDVTDVENPKEVSVVTVGNSNTYSNILDNHKALLFSKERGIIGIPVEQHNNYYDNGPMSFDGQDIDTIKNVYRERYGNVPSDNGYAIYNINLEEGITLKGYIYHENKIDYSKKYYNYYYYDRSNTPVRGLYINDNLYTISDDYIKVSRIKDLKLISTFTLDK
ncbi:MAG: beta-propeller domain-containing protein [Clostridia bacterium]|nr:beta-propeller domain-containing protein [Clostridia bacterium]